MPRLIEIEIEKIVMEEGVRKLLDETSINELSSSIKRHGILQPVVVQPRENGLYTLLIGGRRLMAAKQAGVQKVPAIILEEPIKSEEMLEARLVENLHRENLDPFDEAEAFLMFRDMGYSVSSIAKRLGKSRFYVSKRMRLLKLHPKLREAVRQRTLTPEHGLAILRLEDAEQQLALAQEVIEKKLSVMETRRKIREMLGKKPKWRLIPVRMSVNEFEALKKIAPNGDVKKLIQETIEKLIKGSS
jgi:ParB family chromosome partitioning protein